MGFHRISTHPTTYLLLSAICFAMFEIKNLYICPKFLMYHHHALKISTDDQFEIYTMGSKLHVPLKGLSLDKNIFPGDLA